MEENQYNIRPQIPVSQENKSPIGVVIAAVIIMIILTLGGMYFWGKKINEQKVLNTAETTGQIEQIL